MTKKNTPLNAAFDGHLEKLEEQAAKHLKALADLREGQGEVEEWFVRLRTALGLGTGANRGSTLAALEAKLSQLQEFEQTTSEVANHYGYKKWGNLLNHVRQSSTKAPVELPSAFEQVPLQWLAVNGTSSYAELERRLRKSVQPFVLRWLELNHEALVENPALLDEVVEVFEGSGGPEEFEQQLQSDLRAEFVDEEKTQADDREQRVSWPELLTTLETHLRPHVASDHDWERVRSFEGRPRTDEQVQDWTAKFQVAGVTPREVAELFEEAVFELAGFEPAQGGAPSEWRTLQVEGRLPQGEEFLDVLKQGLPTTREGWLEASPATV